MGSRPLSKQGLDNLVAFTRLLGYLRYFHPSDQAAATDWTQFTLQGVPKVEEAQNARALARTLERLFAPIAPTVQVFAAGEAPPKAALERGRCRRIKTWLHVGLGTRRGGPPYVSKRMSDRAISQRNESDLSSFLDGNAHFGKGPSGAADTLRDHGTPPMEPLEVSLGAGVLCRFPLCLYGAPRSAKGHRHARAMGSARGRPTRLAAVALCWNVFRHFYPYQDEVKSDWPGALRVALSSAAVDGSERDLLDTLRKLVAQAHDGHGSVHHPCERTKRRLPVTFAWVENRLVVARVTPGGAKGLRPGDVILRMGELSSAQALKRTQALISGATPQWRLYRALEEICWSVAGSIDLHVRCSSGGKRKLRLPYDRKAGGSGWSWADKGCDPLVEVAPGIVQVRSDGANDERLKKELPSLRNARGLILDLRRYPGDAFLTLLEHLIETPLASPLWHLPLVVRPDGKDMVFDLSQWSVHPRKPHFPAIPVFLAGGGSISYQETILSMVAHHGLGEIVGSATAGTNGNVNTVELPGGYLLRFTGMKVRNHDGSRFHGVGIAPTVPVKATVRGLAEGRDEVVERAIEIIQSKLVS